MNHETVAEVKKTLEKLVAKKTAMLETAYGNQANLTEAIQARSEQGLASHKLTAMLRVTINNIHTLEEEIQAVHEDLTKLG